MEPWKDEGTLRREYIEKRRSTKDLGSEWGCSHETVRYWLDKHGIERRTAAEVNAENSDMPWRDSDIMERLYVESGMSTREVADELGCDKSVVVDWLERHGIEKRPMGGQYGEDNSQWSGGGAEEWWYHNKRWKRIRNEAVERDGGACFLCGIEWPQMHGHHIDKPDSAELFFDISNVLAVCPPCHSSVFDGSW